MLVRSSVLRRGRREENASGTHLSRQDYIDDLFINGIALHAFKLFTTTLTVECFVEYLCGRLFVRELDSVLSEIE